MDVVLTVIGWLCRAALFVYVFYLAFFKADPSMHNIMMVVGITYLDAVLARVGQATR